MKKPINIKLIILNYKVVKIRKYIVKEWCIEILIKITIYVLIIRVYVQIIRVY